MGLKHSDGLDVRAFNYVHVMVLLIVNLTNPHESENRVMNSGPLSVVHFRFNRETAFQGVIYFGLFVFQVKTPQPQ